MKTFVEICKMTQKEVKAYMREYLTSNGYKVESKDGYLYTKGNIPVLLVAHMDTVHRQLPAEIKEANGRISSPQGIGGDDRCGIFIIMNLIKELKCSVVLTEDEETGGVGARKFANSQFIQHLDVNYIVEFDRMNATDAVFYSCSNEEFTEFVTETTGFKEAYGSFSDISIIAPAAKTAAVNLSCGYYKAHTTDEYVVYDEMMDTIQAAKTLIQTESKKFEYVAKRQIYTWFGSDSSTSYSQPTLFDRISPTKDLNLELEVVFIDEDGDETIGYGKGKTKAEA